MTTQHDPDTTRAWATVALSWAGTGTAWVLDNAGALAALISIAYTVWQWRRQHRRDQDERRTARELLHRLSDEYGQPRDGLDTSTRSSI